MEETLISDETNQLMELTKMYYGNYKPKIVMQN